MFGLSLSSRFPGIINTSQRPADRKLFGRILIPLNAARSNFLEAIESLDAALQVALALP